MIDEQLAQRIEVLERRITALEKSVRQKSTRGTPRTMKLFSGQALIHARHTAGWSQAEVAAALGVSKNTVHNWERGKTRIPEWRAEEVVNCFRANGATPPIFPEGGAS